MLEGTFQENCQAVWYESLNLSRFFELLVQDRIDVIGSRETETEKQVEKLKNDSLKQVEEEAQKLKVSFCHNNCIIGFSQFYRQLILLDYAKQV